MTKEELKIKIGELFPSAIPDDTGEWLTINIAPGELIALAEILRKKVELSFDYLFCQTCVDWKTHLTMVYHLESTIYRHQLVLKAQLDRNKPEIETVSHIWRTAEFNEREAYEMFGVIFFESSGSEIVNIARWMGRKIPHAKRF